MCSCPQCEWRRRRPTVPFIPVGVELLAIYEAHPEQALLVVKP